MPRQCDVTRKAIQVRTTSTRLTNIVGGRGSTKGGTLQENGLDLLLLFEVFSLSWSCLGLEIQLALSDLHLNPSIIWLSILLYDISCNEKSFYFLNHQNEFYVLKTQFHSIHLFVECEKYEFICCKLLERSQNTTEMEMKSIFKCSECHQTNFQSGGRI